MLIAALVLATVAGLLHVGIFVMESVLFDRPAIYTRFGARAEDVAAMRPWAYNQGFYNLFLAIGALTGVGIAAAGPQGVGLALVLLACGSMLAAALVLVTSNRAMVRSALTQGMVPLLAVLAAVLVLVA